LGKGVEHQMLAQLGRLAVAHRVGEVDVLFRTSPKNRPALDFLEQAGHPIRQERDDATVFRFSAEAAANIAFSPPAATANHRTPSSTIPKNGDVESNLGMAPPCTVGSPARPARPTRCWLPWNRKPAYAMARSTTTPRRARSWKAVVRDMEQLLRINA